MPQKQTQIQATKTRAKETEEETAPVAHNDKLDEDVNDILDEIDAVLEPNAEAFVRFYVQKGGQ